jgi:hypothetical protein
MADKGITIDAQMEKRMLMLLSAFARVSVLLEQALQSL